MPCATVHLLVAEETLSRWSASPHPDFAVRPATRDAFLHGSLAPDVGFIPGVDRFVSELAHYHRPADLCRALLARATTEEDKAFVWGWVAHVLGDVKLHPMVGRAVGEVVHNDRSRRMDAAEDLYTHVATEVGLDIALVERHPQVPPPPPTPYFKEASRIGVVREALHDVYGVAWDAHELLRDHKVAVSRTRQWPRVLRAARLLGSAWRSPLAAPLSLALLAPFRWMAESDGALQGVLEPRRPQPWLVDAIERGARKVADDVDRLAREGLSSMANRNLETGRIQVGDNDLHQGAILVRKRLGTT